jgi:hypothetical protein
MLSKEEIFNDHPFSKFSAEEEVDYLKEIYFQPNYHDEIYSNLKTSASRFIIGKRGIGKSALLLSVKNKLKKELMLTVIIDDYRNVPLKKNINFLLQIIIQKIITDLCLSLLKNKAPLKKLNDIEKDKLVFIIINFYKTLSAHEFKRQIELVVPIAIKNKIKAFFNQFITPPVNILIDTGVNVVRETLFKHLDIVVNGNNSGYKNYFPQLEISKPNEPIDKKILLQDGNRLIEIVRDLSSITTKLGYAGVVVLLDKIDEKKELGGTIDKIVDFTQDILLDTSFLQIENVGFCFSLWSEVKTRLNTKGVRFDKFPPIDITWTQDNLKDILFKRLNYFSNQTFTSLDEVFENQDTINMVINLSNNSPRDMIILMSKIHAYSMEKGIGDYLYDIESVSKGCEIFVKEYDYRSVYPSSTGSRSDIISYISKLLTLSKKKFGSKDLAAVLKASPRAANNQIKQLKDYGLIIEDAIKISGNEKQYVIIDPKILFAIDKGLKIG